MNPDRRQVLRVAAGLVGAGMTAGCGIWDGREPLNTVGKVAFDKPLPIPPALQPQSGQRYSLTLQTGRSDILPGNPTATWGVNGAMLGPTLRVRRGDTVRMDVHNQLPEATTVHWHGMRVPAAADGGPHQTIAAGGRWSPSWTVDQPAATLWYHPHPHGQTERHVYKGLGGLLIIDDPASEAGLPDSYGLDDVPVIIQDKTFDPDGELVESERHGVGMLGDTMLINGAIAPVLKVGATHTRLRLLNASTARSYNLGFSDDRTFAMVASDGGLLASPVDLDRIRLTPGERAEVVVDMAPSEDVTLRSYAQDLTISDRRSVDVGADDVLDLLLLRSKSDLRQTAAPRAPLVRFDRLTPGAATVTRRFELGNNRINGERMDMGRIDEVVKVGATEIWEVINVHHQPHNFHIHDTQFQILDLDGQEPPTELSGWKDTVYAPPGVRIRLIMRFGPHTDADLPYMYHCHLMWHEDAGMMGQFLVVERR